MTKNQKYRCALIGTESLRGREIKNILSRVEFPLQAMEFFDPDIEEDYSKLTDFKNEPKVIRRPSAKLLEGTDLVFLAADSRTNKEFGILAADLDYWAIDLCETFNNDTAVPLFVPGVNALQAAGRKKILIANPHPVAIFLSHVCHRLRLKSEIKKAVAFILQPASAFDEAGIHELVEQSCALLSSSPFSPKVFKDQVAFNVLSQMEKPGRDGFSAVEKRILAEIRRLLGEPSFPLTLSLIQVPVFHTYSLMVYVELNRTMDIASLETLFSSRSLFSLYPRDGSNQASTATVSGKDEIFIGQIKKASSVPGGFWIWIVADNLTSGSGLNAFAIARSLLLDSRADA